MININRKAESIAETINLLTPNYKAGFPGVISMYLGTAEACTLLAAEEGGLRGGGE